MFGIGMPELLVIVVIALLVVGPKKLPDLAKALGKGLSEFRKVTEEATDTIKETLKTDDLKKDMDSFKDSLLYGNKDEEKEKEPPATPVAPAAPPEPVASTAPTEPTAPAAAEPETTQTADAKPAEPKAQA